MFRIVNLRMSVFVLVLMLMNKVSVGSAHSINKLQDMGSIVIRRFKSVSYRNVIDKVREGAVFFMWMKGGAHAFGELSNCTGTFREGIARTGTPGSLVEAVVNTVAASADSVFHKLVIQRNHRYIRQLPAEKLSTARTAKNHLGLSQFIPGSLHIFDVTAVHYHQSRCGVLKPQGIVCLNHDLRLILAKEAPREKGVSAFTLTKYQ